MCSDAPYIEMLRLL